MKSILGLLWGRRQKAQRPRPPARRWRLEFENLEDRTVLSSSALTAPAFGSVLAAPADVTPNAATRIMPLRITGVSVQDGQLFANGLLGGQAFSTPLTLATSPSATASTPILELQLAPIHLDLLGLKVDTSRICLDITAQKGPGNLLGNLLSDVAHLLDNGTSLGAILGGLNATQTQALTTGMGSLLNGGLRDVLAVSSVSGVTGNILHLSLGPVDLNLLGLKVHLDNCANGPVTVDITAQGGPGNLLGNLFNDLANLLNNGGSTGAIQQKVEQIANALKHDLNLSANPILPVKITSVTLQGDQLVATGTIGGQTFTTPVTLTTTPSPAATPSTTPILELQLAPIHLDLLGLKVDTSRICLDITAQSGPGNLLGNLLSDIAHLLDNGGSLTNLTQGQLSQLNTGLTSLLNGALRNITSLSSVSGVTTAATGNILHLSLGPVNLNLLGLHVRLDNCANGPVTVDITAQSGPGNLLGNLLNDLANLLNGGAGIQAIEHELAQIAGQIRKLL
jgi:hypothetical protein